MSECCINTKLRNGTSPKLIPLKMDPHNGIFIRMALKLINFKLHCQIKQMLFNDLLTWTDYLLNYIFHGLRMLRLGPN